ncbi:MAG: hypothetical protein QNJ09_06045 [Paracoccaceae bacterium]|nr:hypothetical protein [Paracoccaceae bacterium]
MILILGLLSPQLARADDRLVRLHAPQALIDTGLLRHILPRFKLKTQVRVEPVGAGDSADMVLGPEGRALFEGAGAIWHMDVRRPDHPGTKRFADWLTSEVGKNTVLSFAPEGVALFAPPPVQQVVVAEVEMDGDAELGREVSHTKCARCHLTERGRGQWDIGSTPSFFVLRAMADWESRFSAFYALRPHGAFTQITDVTEPFPEDRPSPIVPIELTLDEVEAVLAYVAGIKAADLGQPIEHQ